VVCYLAAAWSLQLWPTDIIPPRTVGKMVLDTNIDNFFAEAEQIAFCPAVVVPGEGGCSNL
jgi:catalase